MEPSAADRFEVRTRDRPDGVGGRALASLAGVIALLASFGSSWYSAGDYGEGPRTFFPYTELYLVVAGLALAAALMAGRHRRLRFGLLVLALGVAAGALAAAVAGQPDWTRAFRVLGYLSALTALPLVCAAILVWLGEAQADQRRVPRLAVGLTALGGLVAFPGSALLGYNGVSGSLFIAVSVVALCSAGIMCSRYRIGAVGALICALAVVCAAVQALRDPLPVTSDVAGTCLPIVAPLLTGAVLAWRAASQRAIPLNHA